MLMQKNDSILFVNLMPENLALCYVSVDRFLLYCVNSKYLQI